MEEKKRKAEIQAKVKIVIETSDVCNLRRYMVVQMSKPHTSQLTRNSTSMSVPASSAQIPTGHAHSVNRSGGVIALSHSDFSPNTRKREVVRENGLDSGRKPLYIGSGKAASVFVLTPHQA
ncbi:hypothetical protein BD560DRAFT_492278 [Blakeslea trispora]|nr:hypothetical protein BD560DRAFT_492278 [Blakeslea trispora]